MKPCLTTALTRSDIKRLREKNKHQNKQKQKFFSECAKKNTNIDHSKNFMKTHIVQQAKIELQHDINEKILFELYEIGWNL